MQKLITCNNAFEAELIKGRLASEGIDCILTNEFMTRLYAPMVSSFTGINILVRREDLERAQAILDEQPIADERTATSNED